MNETNQPRRFLRFAMWMPAFLAGLALGTPAYATEAKAEAAPDYVKVLRGHLKANDGNAIKRDLDAIASAYPETESRLARKRMLAAVGSALRVRNEAIQGAALDAFKDMQDAAAWRHYRSLLAKPFKGGFPRLASQAMDVTRALKPEAAIDRLLTIARKSKNLAAAAKAVETLGVYGSSKQRAKILGEIIAVTQKEQPGVRGRDNTVVYGPRVTGEQARNRWQALAGPMVEAANELTGQSYASPEDWFTVWRENKRKPGALFENE